MPLVESEIVPGVVAYLATAVLHNDPDVVIFGPEVEQADGSRGVSLTARDGPFVCVAANGSNSSWSPLTSQAKPQRLRIEAAWVSNGYDQLGNGVAFLQDGAVVYSGPNASFILSAQAELPFATGARPVIGPTGLLAIEQTIRSQKKRATRYRP